ncbi:MAG: carbohydrate ABC transporter permease [Oscillospiraceae bacterium]|jgi:multiple sugar transport system permease protein|nr:carbohydrate ABC transporter permease [Oscillospiraceae bacterium]
MRVSKFKKKIQIIYAEKQLGNERHRVVRQFKGFLMAILRAILIIGLSYVILGPLIGIIANSFFSNSDKYSPIIYLIPQNPTLERYRIALLRMDYWNVMRNMLIYVAGLTVIQLFICSMVGYGFARYTFPFKKLLFACVVIMIVIPSHTVMLPLFTTFREFNPFGLVGLFNDGESINLLGGGSAIAGGVLPMFIMTLFGCGLRAGLYIYIFNQFFRALPKEIEEAAEIDGAGTFYTYMFIMMPNAKPSIITVTIFSIVWQYNDTFFTRLFNINDNIALSKQITSLWANVENIDRVMDRSIIQLYVNAGIVLVIIPVIVLYVLLQKQFIEGVERSGIVG